MTCVSVIILNSLFDSPGTQTPRTDLHSLYRSGIRIYDSKFLKVGIPDLLCLVVSMTHAVSYNRPFAADLAKSGHNKLLSEKSGCFLNHIGDFCKYFLKLFRFLNSNRGTRTECYSFLIDTGCPVASRTRIHRFPRMSTFLRNITASIGRWTYSPL